MNKKCWAFLLTIPMLVLCCGNKDNPGPGPDPVDPEITIVGDNSFSWDCAGGQATLTFNANCDWTVSIEEDWLTSNPASGKSSTSPIQVTLTCDRNTQSSDRSMYIVITSGEKRVPVSVNQDGDPMSGAAPEIKSGAVVLATNPLVEAFLTDPWEYKDWPEETAETRKTKIFEYYGGFDGKTLTWDNWETEWPDGDKPQSYSIRWKVEDMDANKMNLHLADELGWSGDMEIAAKSRFVNITNLVPNDKYTYKVTTAGGKVLAEGNFSTTGSLHQVFFTGPTSKKAGVERKGSGCRNARDLGGWTGLDGKKVKYRKIYRGGRMNEKWTPYPLNAKGQAEVLFEGIGAEIDLRGSDDIIKEPAVAGLAHCHPVIEEGGKVMLGVVKPSAKNCAKWLKFDKNRSDIADVNDYTPTEEEYAAFQTAYKAKTKECFEFVLDCVRNNKPVYFHCSLGRDRTGTLDILLLGLLGVREGVIAREYELTYFAPVGYSVSSSDKSTNKIPTFHNTRLAWVYSDVVPYFWQLAGEGTFAQGVEKYLLEVAGVPQADIDEFRNLMLE